MNAIDPKTIIAFSAVLSCLMSLVLYALKRNYPASIKGLGEWSASLLIIFIGASLATAAGFLSPFFTIFIARLTLALGLYLTYVGTQRFFGVTPRLRPWLLLIAAMMLVQLWFTFVAPSFHVRLVLSNMFGAYVLAAHAYLIFKQRSPTFARVLTIVILLIMSAIQLMRLVTSFYLPLGDDAFDRRSMAQMFFIGSFVFCVLLFSIGTILMASERLHAELEHLATHDPLTNAVTRRYMNEACDKELERCRRHGRSMALLILDLDHFKQINDTYGHQTGDRVLVNFASSVSSLLRRPDQLGRFGGEEFMVMLPDTSMEEAVLVAQRIHDLSSQSGPAPNCTVSIGVTTYRDANDTVDTLLARADAAMYQAKTNGRNRTETA